MNTEVAKKPRPAHYELRRRTKRRRFECKLHGPSSYGPLSPPVLVSPGGASPLVAELPITGVKNIARYLAIGDSGFYKYHRKRMEELGILFRTRGKGLAAYPPDVRRYVKLLAAKGEVI